MAQSSKKDSVAVSKEKLKAQELARDSAAWLSTDTSSIVQKKHSPRKATIYSLVCPGLGQVYNRQYWKTPIILGFGVFFGIMISSNNFDYQQAKNDYRIRVKNEADNYVEATANPNLYDAYDPKNLANLANNVRTYETYALRSTRDAYRRDRDFYIIMSGLVYALNIIDATVFAHLREFKMSEKLSMRIDPDIRMVNYTSPSVGLSCNFVLK